MRMLLFVAAMLVASVVNAQAPFDYSRAHTYGQRTNYYGNNGALVGRSYNTPYSTYWQYQGRNLGRSFSTRSANSYFHKTGR